MANVLEMDQAVERSGGLAPGIEDISKISGTAGFSVGFSDHRIWHPSLGRRWEATVVQHLRP